MGKMYDCMQKEKIESIRYIFPSLTLKRRINSPNPCDYGHCGCFGVCIDMYYIFVFVLFAFFVFDTILRIELLVINSKSVLNLNVR